MNCCINMKSDHPKTARSAAAAPAANDAAAKKMTQSDFKNNINQAFKNIDDFNYTDDLIIEYLHSLNLSKQYKQKIVEIKNGSEDFTLLHSAARQCRAKLCSFLINEFKIDKDILCVSKSTPLQVLVKSNVVAKTTEALLRDAGFVQKKNQFTETFNVFVEKNANINHQDDLGLTPLHLAIQKRNFEGALLLINSSAINCNIHDKKLQTPLHLACKYGPDEIISFLIDKTDATIICSYKPPTSISIPTAPTTDSNLMNLSAAQLMQAVNPTSPLHLICKNKEEKLDIMAQALEKLKRESTDQRSLIEYALQKEDLTRQTIGHLAIANNHVHILELLFSKFDLNREVKEGKMGNFLIHTAAKNGSTKILQLLEDYEAVSFRTNANKENALHIAAEYNSSLFIREFLDFENELVNNPESERFMRCMCVCDKSATLLRTSSMLNAPALAAASAATPADSGGGGAGGGSAATTSSGANATGSNAPTTSANALLTPPNSAPVVDSVQIPVHVHQPAVRAKNKDLYTPLMTALAFGNHKCVEELIASKEIELETKDIEGNSIYHICARFNNTESLKYLLEKYFTKTTDILYSKNNHDETVFHTACRSGHLECIKIILKKLYETNYSILLNAKNLAGQTCFHVASIKGYHNIVEYFLRDIKFVSFLEAVDNDSNSSLHFAAENGHSSIVQLLLEFGCDVESKNELNLTPLDLSCRQGFFEISKMLIMRYSKVTDSQTPLHAAAAEGAHEVVKLLLEKGANIDKLDEQNRNCLDIAISRGHREVVRVLLEDKNWDKLIRLNNFDDENVHMNVIMGKGELLHHDSTHRKPGEPKLQENPQLVAMFEHKMWDSMNRVLDRCIHPKYYDFSKIDMPLVSMSKHPLMLIAQSGQENLLKHKTTITLLDLKWRHIPRLMYNFNMLYYIVFLILLSVYSIELANVGTEFSNEIRAHIMGGGNEDYDDDDDGLLLSSSALPPLRYVNNTPLINLSDFEDELAYQTSNKLIFMALMIFLISSIIKEAFQFLVLEGFSYFSSLQNIAEMLTYTLSIISLVSTNYNVKAAYGSLAILFAFLVFPLYIQKLKVFGVYVVAFLRTLSNSAKFFPVFLIIYVGFMLSFRIRSNYGVSFFDSTLYSLIRTFTMVSGELETDKMGLTDKYGSIPNYVIYLLFIGLMCTILINLFVGIAVGEIKTVLDEADLQQISMRIMFVLKVQSAIAPFKRTFIGKYLNMSWVRYYPDEERSIFKLLELFFKEFTEVFKSKQPQIKLVDPQKRLEDTLLEMTKQTNDQIKSIKALFNNQVNDVETKLNNSQIRVEDGLNEMSRNTMTCLDQLNDQLRNSSRHYLEKLDSNERRFQSNFERLSSNVLNEFNYSKLYVEDRLTKIESKLDALIQQSFRHTNSNLDTMNSSIAEMLRALQRRLSECEDRVTRGVVESGRAVSGQLASMRNESFEALRGQLLAIREDMRQVQHEMALVKSSLSAAAQSSAASASASGGPPPPSSSQRKF